MNKDTLLMWKQQGQLASMRSMILPEEWSTLCDLAIKGLQPEAALTQNDKRWRILEHGCQWVSFCRIGGEQESFDPRDMKHLKGMRAAADEIIEKQLAVLREGIEKQAKPQEEKHG